MKKRLLLVMMIGAMAFQMMACGSEPAPAAEETQIEEEATPEASTVETAQIANPWKDITEDEAFQLVPNGFSAPEGATNVKWSACGDCDPMSTVLPGTLVQMAFDLDGMSYVAREQNVGDTNTDISGMYYDWTVTDDITLAGWAGGQMPATYSRFVGDSESADVINWYDFETGAAYSFSTVAKDLEGFDLQAIAEAIYDPAKQIGANIPDDEDAHVPMDITGCDTFTNIVDKLQPGQAYANAQICHQDVLLVSDYTYDYDGDGKRMVAIDADIYTYDADGKLLYLGYVTAGGTAYPLAVDDRNLYVGSNHWMKKMITTEYNILAVDEAATVEYDTDGNATYYHTSEVATVNQDTEGKVEDDTWLNLFFENYANAEIIEFNVVQ